MKQERILTTNRNVTIANCIFGPTITTAIFFITFLFFLPRHLPGEQIYWIGGVGSVVAAFLGWVVAFRYRESEGLNLVIRWLMMILMATLVLFAAYFSFRDLKLFLS